MLKTILICIAEGLGLVALIGAGFGLIILFAAMGDKL